MTVTIISKYVCLKGEVEWFKILESIYTAREAYGTNVLNNSIVGAVSGHRSPTFYITKARATTILCANAVGKCVKERVETGGRCRILTRSISTPRSLEPILLRAVAEDR